MKTIIFCLALLAATTTQAQCLGGLCKRPFGEGATITASMIVDNSFRYYQPSGFAGIGVHAGVWVNNMGFTLGYVESKVSEKANARRDLAFTMQARALFFEERIQAIPFFAVGSNNYQDAGLRVGYRIFNNTYVGLVGGYQMKYGLSVTVSTGKR